MSYVVCILIIPIQEYYFYVSKLISKFKYTKYLPDMDQKIFNEYFKQVPHLKKITFTLGLLICTFVFTFTQTTYYIDPTYSGSDSDGSKDKPYTDFPYEESHVAIVVPDNTTFLLKGGTTIKANKRYSFTGNYLTFATYGNGRATIHFPTEFTSRLFRVDGKENRIENINLITDNRDLCPGGEADPRQSTVLSFQTGDGAGYLKNIFIQGGFRGVAAGNSPVIEGKLFIDNVDIDYVQHDGYYITHLDSLVVKNSEVTKCNISWQYSWGGDCLQIGEVPQIVVDNCIFDHSTYPGKFAIITTGYKLAVISNCVLKSLYFNEGGACIYPGGNSLLDENGDVDHSFKSTWEISNCLLDGGRFCVQNRCLQFNATNCIFTGAYECGLDGGNAANVVNCNFSNMPKGISMWTMDTHNIKNNIFYNIDYPVSGNLLYGNNNLYYNKDVEFDERWKSAVGNDIIIADPLFVDAVNNDFRIQENSPCIDSGDNTVGLNYDYYNLKRPLGEGIDIGAIEFIF